MLLETLLKIFNRDLNKLKEEIKAYKVESNLWIIDKEVTNCSGNLCLHLIGNLNHFIGAELGGTGYVRKRDLEFSLKDVSRDELLRQVDETMTIVERTLNKLTPEDLEKEYRRRVFEDYMTTGYFLVHLSTHLAYHLGQINYHRRLLDS
ncbi:DinB family protein [Flavobacteriaceae bacterium S0825]|uniref:DinB family protein n=1 Tax=Gaetbulibacter sp. S0825 TaxID=2720084 RepID=UPI001431389F|nr:DinB family protein [Gaetbulibacter sp. S0825]MCK0109924.1 DinB family protein [Flavobacteriaceae bacterium S0825]NIX65553.1 DinB family protein [Gaetbulibacter sp. S0825]